MTQRSHVCWRFDWLIHKTLKVFSLIGTFVRGLHIDRVIPIIPPSVLYKGINTSDAVKAEHAGKRTDAVCFAFDWFPSLKPTDSHPCHMAPRDTTKKSTMHVYKPPSYPSVFYSILLTPFKCIICLVSVVSLSPCGEAIVRTWRGTSTIMAKFDCVRRNWRAEIC